MVIKKKVCDHALNNKNFYNEMYWKYNNDRAECKPSKVEYKCKKCLEVFVFELKETRIEYE